MKENSCGPLVRVIVHGWMLFSLGCDGGREVPVPGPPPRAADAGVGSVPDSGSATSSPEDLGRAVFRALRDGDFPGYVRETTATQQGIQDACPLITNYTFDRVAFQQAFDRCRNLYDFTAATIRGVDVRNRMTIADTSACGPNAIERADHVEVSVTGPSGSYTFKVDKIWRIASGWIHVDTLDCPSP